MFGCIQYDWRVTSWLSPRLSVWATSSVSSLQTHAVSLCSVFSVFATWARVKQSCLCRLEWLFQYRQLFSPKDGLIEFRHHLFFKSFPIWIWIRFLSNTRIPASRFGECLTADSYCWLCKFHAGGVLEVVSLSSLSHELQLVPHLGA